MKTFRRWFATRSLSRDLTIYSFVLTFCLLVICWGFLYWYLTQTLVSQDRGFMRDRIQTVQHLLEEGQGDPSRLQARVETEWNTRTFERFFIRILDSEGRVITQTPHMNPEHRDLLAIFDARATAPPQGESLLRVESQESVYQIGVSRIGAMTGSSIRRYVVEIALDRTGEETLLGSFRHLFFFLLLGGGCASLWIGRSIVKKAINPIREVSQAASQVSSASLGDRLHPESLPVEFREWVRSYNDMLNRLDESFQRLSRFSADMAHELRTPLNNLMGSFSVMLARERSLDEYRQLIGSGIEDCERLKRIIDSLLFIARSSDPSVELAKQRLSVNEELETILSFYELAAEDEGIRLELQQADQVEILAERTLLQRAIGNLLSNSIRYSPRDSAIKILVSADPHWVTVEVVDQGIGIPAPALPHLGERFFRTEASRSTAAGGTGLGLSIVKTIVRIHGGEMSIQSVEGQGTRVSLRFPRASIQDGSFSPRPSSV